MRTVLQDLRYSFRQLIKLPGFTLTAVISLALGIGGTTAVFSVVYAILMDPIHVVSYTVAQRTNEFGIRIALGAQPGHMLSIVVHSMLVTVGPGILMGFGLTLALNKVMATWATESTRDPLLLIASAVALGLVAALACLLPARRAAAVNPMTAIRYE